MDKEIVTAARNRVSNQLGEKLANKASDEFCVAFGLPAPTLAGLEAMTEIARPRSIVLEMVRQPELSAGLNQIVDELRNTEVWSQLRSMLNRLELPALTSGVTTELMEPGTSEPALLPVSSARLLRYVKVVSLRDNFLKVSSAITDQLEKSARGSFHAELETVAAVAQPRTSITQTCWLNRTIRSFANPQILTEVAADDSIERIDLTRRLEPEIDVGGITVGAPQFREKFNLTGKGIIVAVIDSEVALNHPALKGRVAHKQNFTDEPWGNSDLHGTAVAGIIASNDANFGGMAPEATIYNYKVLATNRTLTGDDFDGAIAIQQALEDGVHVANCSWGAGAASDGTSREAVACDEAWALGLTIIKSAGNKGPGAGTLTSPADAEGVIVVGATDRQGHAVQNYSSRGPAGSKTRPHLVAPGGIFQGTGITSCLVGGGFGDCGPGTSFAAPHVSGLVALLLEQDPNLRPDDLRTFLLQRCTPLPGIDKNIQGAGLVSLA
jgi:serine protease AprX